MKFRLSYESLFQAAFAISPFPFYLPQYFSMMQQLSSSDSNDVCFSPDSLAVAANEPLGAAIDRGGDHLNLRKRNHLEAGIASPPSSAGLDWTLYGTPSNSFEGETKQPKPKELDTGLSRATVLLLLSAHLLRLLYFHGVILLFEERRTEAVEPGVLVSTTATAASATYSHTESSNLQWDLLGQSISMIAMQLLLLHTMMLIRRKQLKRQMKRMCDGEIAGQHSSDSSSHFHTITVPPMSGSYTATSLESSNHGCNNRHTSPSNAASQHIVPYWQAKRQQCYRATTDHLHQLLSPHNILQSHSFLEYCELLMLVSITVKLVFDYHWFPLYGIHVVDGLKHMSIVLESCLAMPQAIRNHRKGTTKGLSMVMVGGWVAGDFFKLCYFLSNMMRGGESGNIVFVWGCLFSLALDSTVGLQVARTKPEAMEWQKRMLRSFWHWKANKDDDAGDRTHGVIVKFFIVFFRWVRGSRPLSNS